MECGSHTKLALIGDEIGNQSNVERGANTKLMPSPKVSDCMLVSKHDGSAVARVRIHFNTSP